MAIRLPPIWVVNLARSVERRSTISAHLRSLGLDFEIVEAIDGRALTDQERAACCDDALTRRLIGRELTPPEIGCALSHLELYRRQVQRGLEEVLILEDDVEVSADLADLLAHADELPPDWELINLCRGDSRVSYWSRRPFRAGRSTIRFASIAYNAGGYLLRQSGAAKLLRAGYPIRGPADHLTGGDIRAGVRIYGIDPPCIRHREGESTMPEAHAVQPRWPRRDELSATRWLLHRARWATVHFLERLNPFGRV